MSPERKLICRVKLLLAGAGQSAARDSTEWGTWSSGQSVFVFTDLLQEERLSQMCMCSPAGIQCMRFQVDTSVPRKKVEYAFLSGKVLCVDRELGPGEGWGDRSRLGP